MNKLLISGFLLAAFFIPIAGHSEEAVTLVCDAENLWNKSWHTTKKYWRDEKSDRTANAVIKIENSKARLAKFNGAKVYNVNLNSRVFNKEMSSETTDSAYNLTFEGEKMYLFISINRYNLEFKVTEVSDPDGPGDYKYVGVGRCEAFGEKRI